MGLEEGLREMELFREMMRKKHKAEHPEDCIEFGDFSWDYNTKIEIFGNKKVSLKIGKFCSIAKDVTIILGGEHHYDWISTYAFSSFFSDYRNSESVISKGDITIGNDVVIGSGAKILSGVTIGDGCGIGANSLVCTGIPSYTICAGIPAKVIRKRFSDEVISKLEEIEWWNWPDEKIYNAIPLLQSGNIKELLKYSENGF